MPDQQGNTKADEETIPDTALHAYKDSRKEDIREMLTSALRTITKDLQATELEDPDEAGPPKKA